MAIPYAILENAVIEVGPGGLVEYLVGRPRGIGDQRGYRGREDDAHLNATPDAPEN